MPESDGLIERLQQKFKFNMPHVDFEGQRLAEKIYQIIIVSFAIVGFGWGYVCQQLSQTIIIIASGFLLSCLLVLPPWPFYRRHPVEWSKTEVQGGTQKASRKKKGGKQP